MWRPPSELPPRVGNQSEYHCSSYQATYLYRELKLRSSVVASGQIKLVPKEQVFNSVKGIWNLSSDQGNLGTFIVTNVRLVWYADINETFNISLPYMQMANVGSADVLSANAKLIRFCFSCRFGYEIQSMDRPWLYRLLTQPADTF